MIFALMGVLAAGVVAQGEAPKGGERPPAAIVLGDRVAAQQRSWETLTTLVVVPDERSFVQALASWTPMRRFPILIDDGSRECGEDIGRFVRAFGPASIVRWSAGSQSGAPEQPTLSVADVQATLRRSWGMPASATDRELMEKFRRSTHVPAGVVVVREGDPAMLAGLALASARGQPIVGVSVPGTPLSVLSLQQADELEAAIEAGVEALGATWREQGDEIEAITLAIDGPIKYAPDASQTLALSDRLGRRGAQSEPGNKELLTRWAWAGQVIGSGPRSVYAAMCSLFVAPKASSAWMFDGYDPNPKGPFAAYDMTKAADALRGGGLQAEVIDAPGGSAVGWRERAARPVDASLLLVNTMGNADFFDLQPGRCVPGDVPILQQPSALHIVHSWSATAPSERHTLAGRWLERGVYFYCGSVHEPFLSAFLPPLSVMTRIGLGAPWGAAMRHDNGPVWKVAILGDPLTLGGAGPARVAGAPALEGTQELAAGLREALTKDEYESAFRMLVLSGRDADLAKLASAVLAQKKDKLTPKAAAWAVLPLFRQQRASDLFAMYKVLDSEQASKGDVRDALWLGAYPKLPAADDALLDLLRVNLRSDSLGRDAAFLANALRAKRGNDAATAMLNQVRGSIVDGAQRAAFEQMLSSTPSR